MHVNVVCEITAIFIRPQCVNSMASNVGQAVSTLDIVWNLVSRRLERIKFMFQNMLLNVSIETLLISPVDDTW